MKINNKSISIAFVIIVLMNLISSRKMKHIKRW